MITIVRMIMKFSVKREDSRDGLGSRDIFLDKQRIAGLSE
jgi:hypothetical protein